VIDIHCCDNLELLQKLPDNHIDLIYCDILYGTGKNFGDYQDLKPIRSEIKNHYIPRIREMRRALKETGSIYLQMDTRINHWMRCILDDIFGYENFRDEIIWHYNSGPRKKGHFGHRHDIILRYSKSNDYIFNANSVRVSYSPNISIPNSKRQYYHPDGKVIGDVWEIKILGQNDKSERVDYSNQKPKALLERIVKASSNENDLVADFYMGSGTTAVVCKELNRNFIGCDISKRAVKLTRKRLLEADNHFLF